MARFPLQPYFPSVWISFGATYPRQLFPRFSRLSFREKFQPSSFPPRDHGIPIRATRWPSLTRNSFQPGGRGSSATGSQTERSRSPRFETRTRNLFAERQVAYARRAHLPSEFPRQFCLAPLPPSASTSVVFSTELVNGEVELCRIPFAWKFILSVERERERYEQTYICTYVFGDWDFFS